MNPWQFEELLGKRLLKGTTQETTFGQEINRSGLTHSADSLEWYAVQGQISMRKEIKNDRYQVGF
jgi:hypothetical protein